MDELRVTTLAGLGSRGMEPMHSNLHRAIILHRIDFESAWHQFSHDLAANILFNGLSEIPNADHQSGLIVIELDAIGDERRESRQIAAVVGIKQRAVE